MQHWYDMIWMYMKTVKFSFSVWNVLKLSKLFTVNILKILNLRIPTGKSTLKKTFSALEKYEYGHWGASTSNQLCIKVFLLKQIKKKKKKIVNGKTPFFVIDPLFTPFSICLHIDFWGNFVWKCCVFNLSNFN